MNKVLQCLSAAIIASCSNIYADAPSELTDVNHHTFQISQTIDYELPAQEPQVMSNIFRWTVEADCYTIETKDDREISFKVLRKKASVNSIQLSKGESMTAVVAPEESFHLSVAPNATVELTNLSEKSVKTRCVAYTG